MSHLFCNTDTFLGSLSRDHRRPQRLSYNMNGSNGNLVGLLMIRSRDTWNVDCFKSWIDFRMIKSTFHLPFCIWRNLMSTKVCKVLQDVRGWQWYCHDIFPFVLDDIEWGCLDEQTLFPYGSNWTWGGHRRLTRNPDIFDFWTQLKSEK